MHCYHKALKAGERLVNEKGIRNVDRVKAELVSVLRTAGLLRVNYAEVVDRDTMKLESEIELGRSLMVVAAWVNEIRLIDNMPLG